MLQRYTFRLLILLGFALSLQYCDSNQDATNHPMPTNILLLTTPDLQYTDLGCWGSEIATPYIDQLATQGRMLSGLRTAPDAELAQKMLLSGHYHPVTTSDTLLQLLRSAGYYNIWIGTSTTLPTSPNLDSSLLVTPATQIQQLTNDWQQIIHQLPTDRPFFTWINLPFSPSALPAPDTPRPYTTLLPTQLQRKRFQSLIDKKIIDPFTQFPDEENNVKKSDATTTPVSMDMHAAAVRLWDTHVGAVWNALTVQQRQQTVVFLLSTRGHSSSYQLTSAWQAASAAHLNTDNIVLEGALASPLIVSGKGISADTHVPTAIVTLPDVMESILNVAQLPAADTVGRAIFPLLRGKTEQLHGDKEYILITKGGYIALRQGEWKLVSNGKTKTRDDFRLYNLLGDPGERNDLSTAYPARKKRMIKYYREMISDAQKTTSPFGVLN